MTYWPVLTDSKCAWRLGWLLLTLTASLPGFQYHQPWSCFSSEAGADQRELAVRLQPTTVPNRRLLLEEKEWQRRLKVDAEIYVIPANNSFAVPSGNVLLGQQLANRYLAGHDVSYALQALAYIAAHEYGHQFQFRMTFGQIPGGPAAELQADAIAGYWIGMRLREQVEDGLSEQEARKIILLDQGAAYDIGDYLFDSNPKHHGTPPQRHAAVAEGIKSGYERRVGAIFQSIPSANRLYKETQRIVAKVTE